MLKYAPHRHAPDGTALAVWLAGPGASDEATKASLAVADALLCYWQDTPALLVATTLSAAVEALARDVARERDIVVIDAPTVQRRGGVRPLGDILAALRGHIDESWRRFLRYTLVSEHGLNVRNRLSHGLKLEASDDDVVLLVVAAMYLAIVQDQAP